MGGGAGADIDAWKDVRLNIEWLSLGGRSLDDCNVLLYTLLKCLKSLKEVCPFNGRETPTTPIKVIS